MAIEIKGTGTSNLASVDANNALKIAMSATSSNNGILAHTNRSDGGSFTGSIIDIDPETDEDYRARVAQDSLVFWEPWAGTTALTGMAWNNAASSMSTTCSGSYAKLNSAAATTAAASARLTSFKTIPVYSDHTTFMSFPLNIQAASVGIANTTWEVGLFYASANTAPTDGLFLRMDSASTLKLVYNFAGTETTSAAITYSSVIPVNTDVQVVLAFSTKNIRLWINDVLIATLNAPTGTPLGAQSTALPVSLRIYNAGSAPGTATQLWVGPIEISQSGVGNAMTFTEAMCAAGFNGIQGISGGTAGQTANYANSAAPSSATLSNTAAGYTTLGGQWQFAAVAGAETDYALFAYQVPAQAVGSHNRGLLIRGISISAMNTVVAVATSATVLQWGIGVGSTNVSLATTDAVTAHAPRRLALGTQTFPVAATVGAVAADLVRTFQNPLYAEAGTFVHVILKMPIGTATATEIFRGTVSIDAMWV